VSEGRREDLNRLLVLARQGEGVALADRLAESVRLRTQRRLDHHGEHEFTDRRKGSDQLLIVLAGYKEYLWPYTLGRIEAFVPSHVDVCIVSPGVAPAALGEIAARCGWSWLATARNSLCMAQNLAIAQHPQARYISKLDEDVFIAAGHVERLLAGYRRVADEGRFSPGFAAPVLNVNGFSYRMFLDELGIAGEFADRFGGLPQACVDIPVQSDGEAARWIWERSLPFDEMAARFAARPAGYTPVPHRFSIGAYVMERDLWQGFGGFRSHPYGDLGEDETQLCKECTNRSRVAVVLHDVFAGHWSFGPQEPVMREALPELADGLRLRCAAAVAPS
jgi:hypothetical protein